MDINELREKILAVLNQATENAKDMAEQATGTMRDFADKAMGGARAGGRIAKLAMEVASQKESLKKTYQEIGRLYYETAKDAPTASSSSSSRKCAWASRASPRRRPS